MTVGGGLYAVKRGDLIDGAGGWVRLTVAAAMIILGTVLRRTHSRASTTRVGRDAATGDGPPR